MTRSKALGSVEVSLRVKALPAQAPHFAHQGPQQLSPTQLVHTKHSCKLHHQDRLALERVSTLAVQSSLGDSLINLCSTLSLASLGSSIFPD